MPRFLILETSGRVGHVAIADGDRLLAARRLEETRRHARDLAPTVKDLLAGQHWKTKDVSAVLVSRGPGSYTGLRVGIMSAKAFAYATGCALLAIDTFTAIAIQAETSIIDVVEDAQQNKLYVQRFADSKPVSPLTIENFDAWAAKLTPDVWVTGPGLHGFEAKLGSHKLVNPAEWHPRPESILKLGSARFAAGERDDLWSVEPLYLRPSSAEEKWGKR